MTGGASRRCPGARVLCYHNVTPAHVLRAVRPGHCAAWPSARPPGAGDARRPRRSRGRRLRVQPARARRRSASIRHGVLPLLVDTGAADGRARRAGARRVARRRARRTSCSSAGSRRTRRSRTTSGWPSTTSATWTRTTGSSSSGVTTPCRAYCQRDPGAGAPSTEMLPERFWFTGAGAGRRAGGVLSARARLRVAERARGFLRAARRGHGDGRAGAGLRRSGGAGDARRRRRVVRAEGSRIRGRAARRADLRRAAPARRHRRPAAAASRASAATRSEPQIDGLLDAARRAAGLQESSHA